MLKILHIVSDDKFIDGQVGRYTTCDNHIVYLKEELTYKGKFKDSIIWIKPSTEGLSELAKKAQTFDLVVIYYLDLNKAKLINNLHPDIKVFWHFFGAEVYHMMKYRYDIYSNLTKKALGIKNVFLKKLELNYIETKATVKDVITGRIRNTEDKIIERAMRRVDFFLAFDSKEHRILKNKISYLPDFIPLPLTIFVPEVDLSVPKQPQIIIGNSRSAGNNHLDILEKLQMLNIDLPVVLPFNYGDSGRYRDKILDTIKSLPFDIKLLEEFMLFNDYVTTVAGCSTAIFNSYRQMALGNVLISLINGVKVYLSEKNPSLEWLKNLGFNIYSIEKHLKKDILSKNLSLSFEDMIHNRSIYKSLNDPTNNIEFVKKLEGLTLKKQYA